MIYYVHIHKSEYEATVHLLKEFGWANSYHSHGLDIDDAWVIELRIGRVYNVWPAIVCLVKPNYDRIALTDLPTFLKLASL